MQFTIHLQQNWDWFELLISYANLGAPLVHGRGALYCEAAVTLCVACIFMVYWGSRLPPYDGS